jgi:hypothetical protein
LSHETQEGNDMPDDNAIVKAIFGDEEQEVIKAGTTAVTRGAGVVAAAFAVGANVEPLASSLTTEQRLWFSIAVGFGWVILAAADVVARAYVTANVARRQERDEKRPTSPRRSTGRTADEDDPSPPTRSNGAGDDSVDYFVLTNGRAVPVQADTVWVAVRP